MKFDSVLINIDGVTFIKHTLFHITFNTLIYFNVLDDIIFILLLELSSYFSKKILTKSSKKAILVVLLK